MIMTEKKGLITYGSVITMLYIKFEITILIFYFYFTVCAVGGKKTWLQKNGLK